MADILAKCISNHQLKCEDSKLTELAAHVRLVDIDPQLTIAQFHGVSLSSVPEALFEGLRSLQHIRFHRTKLVSVPEKLFQGLTSLQRIDLRFNPLTSLNERMFQGLTSLREM
eukprot:TRINITY_DN6286_c0_g1_i6.p1 TRINITY_DN6286_c0_g1~~TRINITY_DN6286_c0_g1_i6.p1  ORF type:complete len:113 (+),score=8.22 TRINITY_DN6286_c0_g1_i6:33-371(+)